MKSTKINITFLALVFTNIHQIFAQLNLPNVFSNNMVLQRETNVNIWGWSYAGSQVNIIGSWNQDTIKTSTDGNGRWFAKLPTTKAGGPYKVSIISNNDRVELNNVLLGDVYLCSGQSNMEWGGSQNLPEIMQELPNAKNPNIRLLQISRTGSETPQDDIRNKWQTLNEQSLKPFSAIGYFIAKRLNEEINVPIGIINAS